MNRFFIANLLTKIVYDYNTIDSLDRDRFRYSAVFIKCSIPANCFVKSEKA